MARFKRFRGRERVINDPGASSILRWASAIRQGKVQVFRLPARGRYCLEDRAYKEGWCCEVGAGGFVEYGHGNVGTYGDGRLTDHPQAAGELYEALLFVEHK